MRKLLFCLVLLCLLRNPSAHAIIFGQVQGIVHDSQHRPVRGASIIIHAAHSDFSLTAQSNPDGAFTLPALPLGEYVILVTQPGFATLQQELTVASNTSPVLHFELQVSSVQDSVTVTNTPDRATTDSVTPTVLINRIEIANAPGADRTNSLKMITDFVPGAYVTHDQLHMRGGHQVTWQIDGVQIPNTNIASNLGAQIDPKDIDYLEVHRGSYNADEGDRTYGVFNVVPRTGFERNNQAELLLSLGNFFQTNDQLNFGSHTERLAYYASLTGNRSDYGLQTPIAQIHHDAANGYGGFASFIYNRTPRDQFRVVTQLRKDFYQIPFDPDPNSAENQQFDSSGLRDAQHETDSLVDFSWVRTFNASTLLQVSPFYHYNSANYAPRATDLPVATTSNRSSNYAGLQASITAQVARNTLQGGFYAYGQRDHDLFEVTPNQLAPTRDAAIGGLVESYISDNFKLKPWLTLIGGLRASHFTADITETEISPRIGVALQVPKLNWVFRGFYGRFYQRPPLLTASGPVIDFANSQNTTFAPLHGERDEEHQFGVQIPFKGWLLDADTFKTRANNFLDHSNIGNSSLYYPVTVDGALIQGWELTLRSPKLWQRAQAHLSYSNQIAKQRGALTGGLVCAPIGSPDCSSDFVYTPVDHDQRNTLSVGADSALPHRFHASANANYGSGFHNGSPNDRYPGQYLPQNATVDLALSKQLGESTTVSVNALNIANHRVLQDNSLTFGGFHWNDPRQLYAEIRFRFHY